MPEFKVGDTAHYDQENNRHPEKGFASTFAKEIDNGPVRIVAVDSSVDTNMTYLVREPGSDYTWWVYNGSLSAVDTAVERPEVFSFKEDKPNENHYHISIAGDSVDVLCDKVNVDKARRIVDILLEEDNGV